LKQAIADGWGDQRALERFVQTLLAVDALEARPVLRKPRDPKRGMSAATAWREVAAASALATRNLTTAGAAAGCRSAAAAQLRAAFSPSTFHISASATISSYFALVGRPSFGRGGLGFGGRGTTVRRKFKPSSNFRTRPSCGSIFPLKVWYSPSRRKPASRAKAWTFWASKTCRNAVTAGASSFFANASVR
jgi:hypothetical protein